MPPVAIGAVMRAGALGRVLSSRDKRFAPGDLVTGTMGWQTVWQGLPSAKAADTEGGVAVGLQRVSVPQGGREIDHLGLYGTSGMTAYFGMFDVGRLRDGDRVVVSGAAGSVGLVSVMRDVM
jgi:NADPH-dependent curcumin reductase CurA